MAKRAKYRNGDFARACTTSEDEPSNPTFDTMGRPKKAAASSSPKKVKSPKMKSERKKKDPNAPKRAQSAYMLWLNENRAKIAKPGMSVVDVSRAAGVEWATVKDKSKWEKQAAEEKKRYEKEMAAYKAGGSASSPKKAGKAKAK